MWHGPSATIRSGLRWRPKLLQWEFLVGIGPDNQVGNVCFETRPPMWHAAGDDDHIALRESTLHAALNAGAPGVRPISEIRLPRRQRFSQRTTGRQHSGAFQHVVGLGDVGLMHGRGGWSVFRPKNAINTDAVASGVDNTDGSIAVSIARRIFYERLDLRSGDVRRDHRRLCLHR